MKTTFLRILALSVPLLAPMAASAAFNPAVVSADARWVVHLDLTALRETQLGQALVVALQAAAPALEQGGLRPDFEKILATAGTLTAYGANFSQNPNDIDGTLVLQGTPDLRKIAEGIIAQATVAEPEKIVEIKGLPFEAYTLNGQATIAFPKEPIILFSKSQAQLVKAYDVVRGAAPSLAKKSSSVLGEMMPKDGTHYLIAASEVPSSAAGLLPAHGAQARILQMATAVAISLGESDRMTGARLQFVASSDDMAEKLDRILQGMAALMTLANSNDQQLAEFLRSITTERKGHRVSIALAYPSERLVQMMHSFQQQAAMDAPQRNNDGGHGHQAKPAPTDNIGEIVGTWYADGDVRGAAPSAQNMARRTFENVALHNGATITVTGRRGGGEHARIDYVEITPPPGTGPAMRYEAEFMRLQGYRIEKYGFLSGGESVRLNDGTDSGSVSFRYQGADGNFTLTVGFVDEDDGKSAYALGVQNLTTVEKTTP